MIASLGISQRLLQPWKLLAFILGPWFSLLCECLYEPTQLKGIPSAWVQESLVNRNTPFYTLGLKRSRVLSASVFICLCQTVALQPFPRNLQGFVQFHPGVPSLAVTCLPQSQAPRPHGHALRLELNLHCWRGSWGPPGSARALHPSPGGLGCSPSRLASAAVPAVTTSASCRLMSLGSLRPRATRPLNSATGCSGTRGV